MQRVEVMYELGGAMYYDRVAADTVTVSIHEGRRATVKTAIQDVHYLAAWRVVIDLDYDGPPSRFSRHTVALEPVATA